MNELKDILSERGKRYGEFHENAAISQRLQAVMREGRNWQSMSLDKREALQMIAAKISRILTGDTEYVDNFSDIGGYSKLVVDRITELSDRAEKV